MPSTYSTSLKLELIGNGEQSGTWGTTTNNNLGTLLEQAITGVQAITMVNADYTLTNFNGASDEARNAVLVVGGTNSAVRNIIAPAVEKLYVIVNNTVGGFAVNIKTAASTGVQILNGGSSWVYCDGSEFYTVTAPSASTNTANTLVRRDGSGNFAAGTITATFTGNLTGDVTGNVTGDVTGNVTGNTSGTASSLANVGGWNVTPSGTNLTFSYNGTNVARLDSSGNLTVIGNVTAYGTI
jgi:hypothetical protein